MQDLIVVTTLHVEGTLMCRVPACSESATVHVDSYMRSSQEECWWDPRNSGPFCQSHASRMSVDSGDCEVRQVKEEKTLSLAPAAGAYRAG